MVTPDRDVMPRATTTLYLFDNDPDSRRWPILFEGTPDNTTMLVLRIEASWTCVLVDNAVKWVYTKYVKSVT